MCRRWSGGPGLAAAADIVRFDGDEHIGRYQSSAWAERGFCTQCGTNLLYRQKARDRYLVWLGTLDDQNPFKVVNELFFADAPVSSTPPT
jgi:hypothetical protein